jgi:hypothetical protein
MKALTNAQRQWVWFAVLWCGGILAALLIAKLTRWVIAIA